MVYFRAHPDFPLNGSRSIRDFPSLLSRLPVALGRRAPCQIGDSDTSDKRGADFKLAGRPLGQAAGACQCAGLRARSDSACPSRKVACRRRGPPSLGGSAATGSCDCDTLALPVCQSRCWQPEPGLPGAPPINPEGPDGSSAPSFQPNPGKSCMGQLQRLSWLA